ncbi:MAG: 3'-5' exonuclease [Candidatus Promineifilaceae bacterium]|nr:3'-5' exonuclease [Candidatus Promineifilaceae bacterium]
MTRRLDEIVVIDVESTCWPGEPPPGQESEIIEIGVCLLNVQSLRREQKRSILVRPRHSTVSHFCTRLTTLTAEQVAAGVSFAEACATLQEEYDTRSRAWASYGNYDRRQFRHQCQENDVPYPFSPSHVNVKNLIALALGCEREPSLVEAFDLLGWSLEGTYHRGDDDAWNIARLLSALLRHGRELNSPETS